MAPAEDDRGSREYRRERHFARRCALQFLYECDVLDDWEAVSRRLGELRRQVRDLEEIPPGIDFERAWRFACALVRGVCDNRRELDRRLAAAAINWTVDRMSVVDRNILRLAAYEIGFEKSTPPVTAVDEGVELAKEFGHADSKRFVNGVLDRILHLETREEEGPTAANGGATPPDRQGEKDDA